MEPCLNKAQLATMGWTARLIPLLLGKPDHVEHKTCKSGRHYPYVEHLFSSARVMVAMRDARFRAAVERRRLRQAAPERRRSALDAIYADWRAALPEAAGVLFSLNRYAKHRACSAALREEIYDLKNRLIEMLYREGLCVACWEHVVRLPELACNRCWGGDGECDHCDGTGVYRVARSFRLFCFRFHVGTFYTWHQPAELVKFAVQTTQPPEDWQAGPVAEKEVPLRKSEFQMGLAILRWVLERAGGAAHRRVEASIEVAPAPAAPELDGAKQLLLFGV